MTTEMRGGREAPVLTQGYSIVEDGKAIRCHACEATSHHPVDVKHRYCGRCHGFHAPKKGSTQTSKA